MASNLPVIQYTSRDFESTVAFLQSYVQTTNPDVWSDFFESNIGQNIIDMIAIQSDILSYVANQISREMFLPTCQRYASGLKHAKLVGYNPRGRTASSLTLTARLPLPAELALNPLRFLAGTQVTVGELTFEVVTEVIFPAGSVAVEFAVSNSVAESDIFLSAGTANQSFTTDETPVVEDSWVVTVNGFEWTETDSLLISQATNVYETTITSEGELEVRFGDGFSGAIPPTGATIEIVYRIGGGAEGNIVTGGADGVQMTGYILAGQHILTFDNAAAATGGADEETLEELKFNIPAWVRTVDKAITQEDYVTLSRTFEDPTYGAVARAQAKLRYVTPSGPPLSGPYGNYIDVYIWAYDVGGGFTTPSLGLKQALHAYLKERRVVTVQVCIQDGVNVTVNVDLGTVTVDARFGLTDVETAINTAITDFFESTAFQPGQSLRIADFYNVIDSVPGVDYFTFVAPTADVNVLDTELIELGSVAFTVAHPADVPPTIGPCP